MPLECIPTSPTWLRIMQCMCINYKYKYAHVGHLIVRGEFKGLVVLGVRPPLNKSLFPVQQVAEISATRAATNSFLFFPLFLVGKIQRFFL